MAQCATILLLASIAACSQPAPPAAAPAPPDLSTSAPDLSKVLDPSTLVKIEGPGGGYTMSNPGSSTNGSVDGTKFEIANGQLKIDGKSYGKVQGGDQVKIEKSGAVTINGKERAPEG
jgi:hypothetical protein